MRGRGTDTVTRPDPLQPRRMLSAVGPAAAREALAALEAHVAGFDPAAVTEPQRGMIRSECETIRRRLSAVEAEAARERGEAAALDGQRESWLRAAEALAGRGDAAADDRERLVRAAAQAGERLAAEREADAETEAWLAAVRAAVEGLMDAGGEDAATGAGGPQPVLRSLGRIGAMLGAMLGEAESRRGEG
jgi:hypothetical protein